MSIYFLRHHHAIDQQTNNKKLSKIDRNLSKNLSKKTDWNAKKEWLPKIKSLDLGSTWTKLMWHGNGERRDRWKKRIFAKESVWYTGLRNHENKQRSVGPMPSWQGFCLGLSSLHKKTPCVSERKQTITKHLGSLHLLGLWFCHTLCMYAWC